MLSAAVIPIFVTIRTLTNTITQFTNIILNPLAPELIRFHALKDGKKISQVIETNWLITNIIVNIPFLIIVPFVEQLYNIWTNDKLTFDKTLFFTLAVSVSIISFGRSLITYLVV